MTTPPQARHVTLMVTHPGGRGHRTLDDHIPVEAADELEDLVADLPEAPGGGRYVCVFASHGASVPWSPLREVDDATADRVVAAIQAHMPERTYRQLLADARDHLRAMPHGEACGLVDKIDAALDHPETS
jgi:hypothetical protein